jgi:hypothetical protein
VDQGLREQREKSRVRGDVVGVGGRDRRLGDCQLLRRERAHLHEAAIGRQCGADEHRVRAAALRKFSTLLQRGVPARVAGTM